MKNPYYITAKLIKNYERVVPNQRNNKNWQNSTNKKNTQIRPVSSIRGNSYYKLYKLLAPLFVISKQF